MTKPNNHSPINSIFENVLQSRTINDQIVKELESKVNEDWIVGHHEVELLFKVNHAIGDQDQKCPQWTEFFKTAVCRSVVFDLESPGEIDVKEGDWLASIVQKYSVKNDSEKSLFQAIRKNATHIAGQLANTLKPD